MLRVTIESPYKIDYYPSNRNQNQYLKLAIIKYSKNSI